MGKTVPLKKFRKYLKSLGLKHIRDNDSHELWDFPGKPLLRPVTVDMNIPDVPITHIHTNLKTLGINMKQFKEDIKNI